MLVSPSTLLATLRIINNIWRYEDQNKNALVIAKKAGDLYDKFVGFVGALDDVGQKIGKAQESYQTARNRLSEGRGNLVRRTEELRQLGVKTQKELPEGLVVKALEGDS
jgi:DNA recombination protein RmuC